MILPRRPEQGDSSLLIASGVPVTWVNLRQSPRAIWAGGALSPMRTARDLLAYVTSGR